MKNLAYGLILINVLTILLSEELKDRYQEEAGKIIRAVLGQDDSYTRLSYLCDTFGHRFSGSESLERSIDWILTEMESDGLTNVHGEEVMVPHWVRGSEYAELLQP